VAGCPVKLRADTIEYRVQTAGVRCTYATVLLPTRSGQWTLRMHSADYNTFLREMTT